MPFVSEFGIFKAYIKKAMQPVKTFDQLKLTPNQQDALAEIRRRLLGFLGIQSIHLFGSVTRDEADEDSDIDLLIITEQPLKRPVRHQITEIVFDINLQYDTNFSTLVVDRASWKDGLFSVLPIHDEILREGVAI
ncbi:MAG: nucleotidyltransferase domain-containing protein [bacterium]